MTEPRKAQIVETDVPKPGPGTIRVRVQGCGLCGSNLSTWEGRNWFAYPFGPGEPGHEGWGIIDELGPGVDNSCIGDRVAFISYRALAEYDIAQARAAVPIPAQLKDSPFPAEAIGCAMNVFGRSDVQAKHTVAIIGIGFLGALLCRLTSYAGANVIAVSRRSYALGIARQFGAAHAIALENTWESTARKITELTNGRGCERVIEVVGTQEALDLAAEVVCTRGRLIIAGYHQDGFRRVDMRRWNWQGLDVINAHERDLEAYANGMRAAAEAIVKGIIDPMSLYTHRFALNELDEAFETLRARPDGFMKALVII